MAITYVRVIALYSVVLMHRPTWRVDSMQIMVGRRNGIYGPRARIARQGGRSLLQLPRRGCINTLYGQCSYRESVIRAFLGGSSSIGIDSLIRNLIISTCLVIWSVWGNSNNHAPTSLTMPRTEHHLKRLGPDPPRKPPGFTPTHHQIKA